MNWIFYSLIMYIASVFQYLLVRKVQKRGIDSKINTFMFLTPAIPVALSFAWISGVSLGVTFLEFILIGVATYFFSYLGIKFSLEGIKIAPNPGYSLIIQKSYAIYTAIVAIFLFNASLSFHALISILIIIAFQGIIMIEKNKSKARSNILWLKYSWLAFFMFGNLALFSKYAQNTGIHPITLAFYIFVFYAFFSGSALYRSRNKVKFDLPLSSWGALIIIGVSTGVFNVSMQLAYKTAPNIGYVNIINAASITAVTFLSAYFFKDKLTTEKVIGALGVLLGLILLITL